MIEQPFISIITPTFNSSSAIEACLISVADQSYQNIEHLIIDGLSSDNTIQIIRKYQEKFSHIKFISEKDKGIYDAMNKGIKIAKGEWIYFLGSDDHLIHPNILKELLPSLNSGYEFIYGNVIWGSTGKVYDGSFDLESLVRYRNICHQSIFYKKELFSELGSFRSEFKYCADHYFNIQCFTLRKKIKYVDKIIAFYNNDGKSSLLSDDNFQKKRTLLIIEMFENPLEVYEKFSRYDQDVNHFKNSKEYKFGSYILHPFQLISSLFSRFTKK